MEIYTTTMTAPKPGFGMPTFGSTCAPVMGGHLARTDVTVPAPATGVVRTAVVIDRARLEGDTAWRPPTS